MGVRHVGLEVELLGDVVERLKNGAGLVWLDLLADTEHLDVTAVFIRHHCYRKGEIYYFG